MLPQTKFVFDICKLAARNSKYPGTKVGACIYNKTSKQVLSLGWNGYARHIDDKGLNSVLHSREDRLEHVIHAEENALLNALRNGVCVSEPDTAIYVTHMPCSKCIPRIVQSGISQINYLIQSDEYTSIWKPNDKFLKYYSEPKLISIEAYKDYV